MFELNINVFCNIGKPGVSEIFKTVSFYDNIKIRFCDMFDDVIGYCLLISDNHEEATSFRSGSGASAKLYSVYYGDIKSIENRVDTVDDMWSSDENLNVTVGRYRKMIAYIKANYDAWFYRNLYSTAMDSIPDPAWYKDLEGRISYVNESFAEIVRRPQKECEGKTDDQIWNVDTDFNKDADIVDSDELVIKEQRTLALDQTITTIDGMMKLATYKSPLFNEFGDIIGTVGIAHDVTELINVRRDKDLLVESVPFPVVVVDSNWKTVVVNGTMRRLLKLEGPAEKFDYLTWKKYFLTPKTEKVVDEEHHFTNQIFTANDNMVDFDFQINEQDIIDVFGNITGHIIIPRRLGPNGEMIGVKPDYTK